MRLGSDRDQALAVRRGASVAARAATFGALFGAALGCSLLVPDLVRTERASSVGEMVTEGWLPLAAATGAIVGVLSALVASAGWLIAMTHAPHRRRRARAVGAACAGAIAFIVSIAALSALTWFGAAAGLVSAVIAYFAASYTGLRRLGHPPPKD